MRLEFPDTLWDHDLATVQWAVVIIAALIAAIIDTRTQRIPNRLTGPLLLAGIIWATAVAGWSGLGDAMLGALLTMLPFFLLFAFAGGGAGDAKLMAGVGAWLGTIGGLVTLICVMIAGGLIAIVVVIARKSHSDTWANLTWIFWATRDKITGKGSPDGPMLPSVHVLHKMPYGMSIFIGVCAAFGVTLQ